MVTDPRWLNQLKSKVWDALEHDQTPPTMEELMNRPITAAEMYYLLQRFATLTIWDVYNLERPGEKIPLTLEGASKHYHIFDRGSCIVGTPKELFSHERNLEDALKTARAMAREVHKRGWVIEFAGFNAMALAATVTLISLGFNLLNILHFPLIEEAKRIQSFQTHEKGTTPRV